MKIAFVIAPNMLATSLTNAFELFYAANQAALRYSRSQFAGELRSSPVARQAELIKIAADPARTTLPSGLSLMPDAGLQKRPFDMVYVPALWRNPRPVVKQLPNLIEWIRWQYEHGAIINSTGTGVCFVAAAGLLDGRPATTHWYFFEQFAKDYPLVELKRQHFITHAGNLYCAASINALTDLTLHHVHRFYGREVAEHLSHHFSHEVRQPYDQLSFTAEENTNHPDEQILQVQLWMQTHFNRATTSINKLADLFGMSPRTLSRRFKQATNLTPIEYLQQCRYQAARELLQNSSLSIKEIAYRVGYLDVSYFSCLFKRFAALTPLEYRNTVRAKLFSAKDTKAEPKA